ncbi:hypothetical protein FQ707_01990 [Bacteroidaceae bacterium HV4-6-C5C]|nr:hypothetical protein FQ707_01990 [Bacteroidaceae bacterium HV4-6-C5C]
MRTFATKELEEVKGGIQKFEKLIVQEVCLLDDFEAQISSNPQYLSEYKTILSHMDFIAHGKTLPSTKFRKIKGAKTKVNEYEFKSKQLRVYACSISGGKLVVMGGYKKTQKNDINKFHSLVREYEDYIKLLENKK